MKQSFDSEIVKHGKELGTIDAEYKSSFENESLASSSIISDTFAGQTTN